MLGCLIFFLKNFWIYGYLGPNVLLISVKQIKNLLITHNSKAMKNFHFPSTIQPSSHCNLRISQRGISDEAVKIVISYGYIIHKQRLKFHFLTKSRCHKLDIPIELVRDLMVITNLDRTEVVTCYKNPNAIHEVKKKSKRLGRTPKYLKQNRQIIHEFKTRQIA